jgi:cytochrome c peroxidase
MNQKSYFCDDKKTMKKKTLAFLIIGFVLAAFVADKDALFVVPQNWAVPRYDFKNNALTVDKIELGRRLFYDPILSRDNTISCNSCHSQYTAFAHVDHALSHGIDARIGKRNSPALINLAWQKSFMWDGSVHELDAQPASPITNADEMGEKMVNVIGKLNDSKMYRALFYNAYKDSVASEELLSKALSAFMLTFVSANAKYDSVMRHEAVFTAQENNGYHLFQKNCSSCHTEPLFTNSELKNNGLPMDTSLNDVGSMKLTKKEEDRMKFKVPSLRNIEFSYPYMHDGRFKKLSDVVGHYTSGIEKSETLSKELKNKIVLSSNEKVDLISFLLTLTDRAFLFNQKYSDPKNVVYNK